MNLADGAGWACVCTNGRDRLRCQEIQSSSCLLWPWQSGLMALLHKYAALRLIASIRLVKGGDGLVAARHLSAPV